MNSKHPGLEAALNYPLFSAIFKRRSRRISRGVWVQAHNLDLDYYDRFYQGGYSESQVNHDHLWYGEKSSRLGFVPQPNHQK